MKVAVYNNKITNWLWDHIGWKVRNIYRSIRNVIRWLPIIWKDRDWDSHYIFEILKAKLQNQAKYIGDQNRHDRSKRDAEIMITCVKLIEKIQDEYYAMEYMDYEDRIFDFMLSPTQPGLYKLYTQTKSENYNDYYKRYPLQYKRVLNEEGVFNIKDTDEDSTKQIIAMNIGHTNHIRAKKLLFTLLERHIEGWWD
jgi:hypothetical protein